MCSSGFPWLAHHNPLLKSSTALEAGLCLDLLTVRDIDDAQLGQPPKGGSVGRIVGYA